VIDNDSWRVSRSGSYIDKQVYRDGGALDDVAEKYRRVAGITGRFRVPRQRIMLWRGSESDKTEPFAEALGDAKEMMTVVTCSVHKEPVPRPHAAAPVAGGARHGRDRLYRTLERRRPDALGDVAGAGHHSAGERQGLPEDVWSSLRAPSNVPVMTVLEPANAVLAALQILSARNPRLYARVRSDIESRAINVIEVV
jgi:phosphoribosylaminoimidazole carboxylase/phosphoribosylaminoimidazole-succinocarboxamide synthase